MGFWDLLAKAAVEEVTAFGTDAALNAQDIAATQKAQLDAIRTDKSLTPDQKQQRIAKVMTDSVLTFGERSADGVLASLQRRLQARRDTLKQDIQESTHPKKG